MRLRERPTRAAATFLIWMSFLSGCARPTPAPGRVTTWWADSENVRAECRSEKLLVRRDSEGTIKQSLDILQSRGYRCYSAEDDAAWRDRMAICCAEARID